MLTINKNYEWFMANKRTADVRAEDVNMVMASGFELDYIIENCKNIPISDRCIEYWYGDHAKYIAKVIGAAE